MRKINNIWDEYEKYEIIGSGAFAKVYRAKNKSTNKYVAIKEIVKTKIKRNNILNEIEIMKKLKSENSLLLIDEIETKEAYYLILELCYISLEEYLKERKESLSINEIREVLLELNKSLKEMKEKNIIHRDLKPSNILLSLNKSQINKISFKISDFGLSKLLDESKINNMSINGTPITMAPEVLKGENDLICDKSDIWSLGIIIYYMLFKEYPYNGKNEYQIIKNIESNKQLKQINNKELDDLIKKMLVININERISWEKYFEHPFFKINSNQIQIINQSNQLNLPIFNLKCEKHSNKDLIGYCPVCKCNICFICYHEHSSKNHKVILFSQIGFTQDELNQTNDLIEQIENNIKKFKKIKDEINDFIQNIKLIKENCSIYENDKENNFKIYSIECLKIINDKLKFEENIKFPQLDKWELRYIN